MVLPIIDKDEIGTIITKNYNNKIQRGEVTPYFEDKKGHLIVYKNGENEKISNQLLNSVNFKSLIYKGFVIKYLTRYSSGNGLIITNLQQQYTILFK